MENAIDTEIVSLLKNGSGKTATEVASCLSKAPYLVRYRLKLLSESNIISRKLAQKDIRKVVYFIP